jgi:hypothetical protein
MQVCSFFSEGNPKIAANRYKLIFVSATTPIFNPSKDDIMPIWCVVTSTSMGEFNFFGMTKTESNEY